MKKKKICIPFSIFPAALCLEGDHDALFLSHSQGKFIRCHRETVLSITVL